MLRPRIAVLAGWVFAASLGAQSTTSSSTSGAASTTSAQKLRDQQAELDRIRNEREALERQAAALQSSAHDLTAEVGNLDQQALATAHIVHALGDQLTTISTEVAATSTRMNEAEQELSAKRETLHRRVVDIYKRGPMYAVEAMLSARSFGELVARYKYLHLLALRDRGLVQRVEELRDSIGVEQTQLVALKSQLEENQKDKAREEDRLKALERVQAASLDQVRQQAKKTADQIAQLKKTESELSNTIAAFEAERKRAEAAKPNAPKVASSIRTSDYGTLDWPVSGSLVYTYGKAQTASNATIHWNGVGIQAPLGSAVRSVAAGTVVSVRPLGTYGLTIIVDHGGGDYSVYGSLARAEVKEQDVVTKGQVLGSVGMSDPDLPPHLHFEIRHGGPAVDPITWLRGKQ